jgi:hypothetical protein
MLSAMTKRMEGHTICALGDAAAQPIQVGARPAGCSTLVAPAGVRLRGQECLSLGGARQAQLRQRAGHPAQWSNTSTFRPNYTSHLSAGPDPPL